jgi:hypothetical protein
LASDFAASIVSVFSFSPWAMMSDERSFASVSISTIRFSVAARLCLPASPAASPSAICFWRFSMAPISGGHMNLAVNQMKAANATACMTSVKLMSMAALGALR